MTRREDQDDDADDLPDDHDDQEDDAQHAYLDLEDVDADEEVDFDPNDDDDDDDDEDDEKEEETGFSSQFDTTLTGSLSLNDEGRLVYAGTCDNHHNNHNNDNDNTVKKAPRFKLKSKQMLRSSFHLQDPTSHSNNNNNNNNDNDNNDRGNKRKRRRTLLFDGFFMAVREPHGGSMRVKERDVELTFCASSSSVFAVSGRGCNDYGSFTLDGTYTVVGTEATAESSTTSTMVDNTLTCRKGYATHDEEAAPRSSKRPRRQRESDDDDDDDVYCADDATDFDEVLALHEDTQLSVEELRKKYYEGGSTDREIHQVAASDDDDDDGCGF